MPECPKCGETPRHPKARFCPSCGAMLGGQRDPEDPWIGRVIGDRYRVVGVLGEGGMGRVYLAEQQMGTVTRKVAVKTLHPDLAAEPAIAKRFNREAETVTRLGHPNTITFHDFGQTQDGTLYIVMEYIKGESLAQVLTGGALSVERTEHILSQICSSLHEAHEMGIIHRDLKPENVVLTQRVSQADFVKVLDFGIAKRTELDADSLRMTRAGVVLGTPPYMSPEQFAGQPLDRRSDIYSLGVMTYEMLTGHLPFEARTPWEWATKHLSASPVPFERFGPGVVVPERFRLAVLRALSKNVDDRPDTALRFLDELAGRVVATPTRARSSAPTQSSARGGGGASAPLPKTQRVQTHGGFEIRRPKWKIVVVICLILLFVGLMIGGLLFALGFVPSAPLWGGVPSGWGSHPQEVVAHPDSGPILVGMIGALHPGAS